MIHQKQYEWLSKETSPKVIVEAVKLYGTKEIVGKQHSKEILSWANEVGLGKIYTNDELPWCVGEETLITTLDGYKSIKDIKENLDFVFTKEGEFSKVLKVLTREKIVNKVYIPGSLPFLVTDDHPFLVKKIIKNSAKRQYRIYEDELSWVAFKDIKEGDLVCRLKNKLSIKSDLNNKNEHFIELLGTYAAEGTTRKKVVGDKLQNIKSRSLSSSLHIGKHELERIKILIDNAGIEKYTVTERRTNYQIEIRDKDFIIHCSEIGSRGIDKKLPYYILNGDDYVKNNFLKGYLNGDGSYNPETKRGSASSISKKLIVGISKLLLDSGIFPCLREDLREGTMFIENRKVNIKNRYIVQYTNTKENINYYLQNDDYFFLPIKKTIKEFDNTIVYDLEVENNHNFIANDIVVHNCGLYASIVVKRAGFDVVKDPLWARNWNNFGIKQDVAMLGDVLVFTRPGGGGHVGFYVGEDVTCYHVLGGNQSNMVNTTRILKSRCIGIRRCPWKISQPSNVRVVELAANGAVSTNEA
jgi:uncharacterized protein (TIGR02594 family)